MDVGTASTRESQIAFVSAELLPQAALLTRLLVRQIGDGLSRTEAGLLNTLSAGPRRITELAELEGLAQPTTTLLVKQLEERGLVRRERPPHDGRVVLVHLSEAGVGALGSYRDEAGAILGAHLIELPDEQVEALAEATECLRRLVALLQQGPTRAGAG
jgi:DNA-binding MarR family transcriptional regulator